MFLEHKSSKKDKQLKTCEIDDRKHKSKLLTIKHIKRCSSLLVIRNIQRQITKRYHFKLIQLAINIWKSEIFEYCPRCGENVNYLLLLMKVWLNIAGGEQFVVIQ